VGAVAEHDDLRLGAQLECGKHVKGRYANKHATSSSL
jgi:hypothetical protein